MKEHPSLMYHKPKASESTLKYQSPKSKTLQQQVASPMVTSPMVASPVVTSPMPQVDLSQVEQRLDKIDAKLDQFTDLLTKKNELLDTELRIARLFEQMLQKQATK